MRSLLLPALVGLAACEPLHSTAEPGDESVVDPQEALVVSPGEIDFGELEVLEEGEARATFTIANVGGTPLAVHGHDEVVLLEGEGAAFDVDAEPWFELAPDEEREFTVRFTPPTEGAWTAELWVNYGIETLTLRGAGAAPVAHITAPHLEPVAFGCATEGAVTVENTGSRPLRIEAVSALDPDAWAVSLPDDPTVAPGATAAVPVVFAPPWTEAAGGPRSTVLTVQTNDPLSPTRTASLRSLVYEGERITDRFSYAPGLSADLLFVAETDAVMSLHTARAVPALDPLFAALDEGNIAHHAAALTTGDTCPAGEVPWVSSDTSRYFRVRDLSPSLQGPSNDVDTPLVGHAAASLSQQAAGCLEGFLQPGAQLHVIVIAGQADPSGQSASALRALLADAAPLASDIVVSAIIATDSAGCDGASWGAGYAELALETGGEILDLCQSDWAGGFQRLADLSVLAAEGASARPLEQQPLPESIQVRVDGVGFAGWTWDPEANTILFAEATAPEAGSQVEISYMTAVDCGVGGDPGD